MVGSPVLWSNIGGIAVGRVAGTLSASSSCEEFPNAEHDDYVDTLTQAMIYMRDARFLILEAAPIEEIKERDYHEERNARRNPYAN